MPAPLSQTVRDAMRQRAARVKEHIASGGGGGEFTDMWQLTGKNAIVQPGDSVVLRLMPRWDRYNLVDGKIQQDAAAAELPIYVPAFEHWWSDAAGKRTRDWCPVVPALDGTKTGECPIDEAAAELRASASKEDQKTGKEMGPKEVFVFNAMVGELGVRNLTEEGKPDIRPIAFTGTIFLAVSDIMTGGDNDAFARGDISDPAKGFDIKLTRPVTGGGGDRWKVDCAPNESRLFTAEEAAAWRGWWDLIVNIDEMLEKETKGYDALYEHFHGVKPVGDVGAKPAAGKSAPAARKAVAPSVEEDMFGSASETAPESPDMDMDLTGLDGLGDAPPGPGPAARPAQRPPSRAGAGRGVVPRGGRR